MKPFDASGAFLSKVEPGQLRRRAVRGAGITVFSNGIGIVTQIASTVVLARLLTPADFGIVAMVTTFSLLLANAGLNGITEAVVRWEEADRFTISNLFWINLAAGILLTLIFAASGSLLARFYHNPLVANVCVGVSLTIFFTSTSVLHLALLNRAMRFTAVSAVGIVAGAVSVVVSIVLACLAWGYWALVAGAVAQPLVMSAGAWMLCPWIPDLPRRTPGTAPMLRFAANVYCRFGVRYGTRNVDNLLVGEWFNAQALGFYKKAYDVFAFAANQLTAPLTTVAVSALSRLNRDPVRLRRYLVRSFGVTALVGMGLGADLGLIGKDVIRLVLGPQWGEAGKIFIFFGPGVGFSILHGVHGWIHLSIGRADRWLRWTVAEFIFTFLLFLLGLHWGPAGVAAAWSASFCLLTIPAIWYAGQPIQLGISPVVAEVWKHVAASFWAFLLTAALFRALPLLMAASSAAEAFEGIILVSAVFFVLYLSAVVVLHRGFTPLRQVAELLRELLPDKDSMLAGSAQAKPSITTDRAVAATVVRGEGLE